MATRLIFTLVVLAAASPVLAQAYRWVDEDGVVHYSDRPHPGAEQIVLPKPNTVNVPRRQPGTLRPSQRNLAAADAAATADKPFAYTVLEIDNPRAEETLWNIEGVLSVSLNVQPALQAGHQVRAYLDGEPQTVNGTNFQLQEVWRGVHNLQVEILDARGQMLIRSQPSRFYVQQNTVLR